MENSWFMAFVMLIPVVAIAGGIVTGALSIHHRARLKELAYRERIALIEKGVVPPPETNPQAFDDFMEDRKTDAGPGGGALRHHTAGVILFMCGLALMLLIAVAGGATRAGLGVGGAVCLVGVGFLLTGWLHGSRLGRAAARPPVDRSDTRPPLEG